jgi:hypothetical protein
MNAPRVGRVKGMSAGPKHTTAQKLSRFDGSLARLA